MSISTRLQSAKALQSRRGSTEMPPKSQDNAQPLEEILKNFQKEISLELKEHRKESNDNLNRGLEKFEKTLENLTKEIVTLKKEQNTIRERTNQLEIATKHLEEQQKEEENLILIQELRYREKCLKLRGLVENSNEDLYTKIIPALASFIGVSDDYFEMEVDKLFRISPEAAREKNLPRDVIIRFARTKIRDEVLQHSYNNILQIDGRPIKIYKDIPANILRRRQTYRQLSLFLTKNNIRYSWDKLEGIIFKYNQKRYKINTKQKAEDFLKKIKKDKDKNFENSSENKKDSTNSDLEGKVEGKSERNLVSEILSTNTILSI